MSQGSIRSSPHFQRPELLAKAWALPVAKRYAPLLSQSFTSRLFGECVRNTFGLQSRNDNIEPLSAEQDALRRWRDAMRGLFNRLADSA